MQLNGLSLAITNILGGRFNPLTWFAAGEQGAWYDPSVLTTLFQDSAGTTPVTAVEQPVGLMRDKSGRGNHAFQATAGNRPILSARVNILTYSQTFASPWANIRSTVPPSMIPAPDGTISGVLFTESSSAGTQFITPVGGGIVASSAGTYTFSVYGKNNGRYLTLAGNNGISNYISVIFDLSLGTYYQYQSGGQIINSVSCTQIGSTGWYRCVVTATFTAASGINIAGSNVTTVPTGGYGLPTYTGDGVSGFYLWGADLRPTNAGALLPPYQRVNTDTDYDSVGFPLYLKCNGTSSAMQTNSIDFTATDKMTVVTGVRKLSDTTNQNVFEMGNTLPAGGFNLYAPNTLNSPSYSAYVNAGNVSLINSSNSYPAPISNVVSLLVNNSGVSPNQQLLRVNAVGSGTQSATLSGNFTNIPLFLFSRASTSSFLNGQFYGAIIRGAQSDAASVTQTENYMAQKTGITF